MCGITGFAERNHKAETARRIVKGMADLITYRGPDGEGYYVDDQVAWATAAFPSLTWRRQAAHVQ